MYGTGDVKRWSTAFQILAAVPRRQIIDSLLHAPPDRELRLPEAANPPESRYDPQQLSIDLMHLHLPKMDDAGYIQWANDPLRVRRGSRFDDIRIVMEVLQSFGDYPDHLRRGCHRLESRF